MTQSLSNIRGPLMRRELAAEEDIAEHPGYESLECTGSVRQKETIVCIFFCFLGPISILSSGPLKEEQIYIENLMKN